MAVVPKRDSGFGSVMPLLTPPRKALCTELPLYSTLATSWFVRMTSVRQRRVGHEVPVQDSLYGRSSINGWPSGAVAAASAFNRDSCVATKASVSAASDFRASPCWIRKGAA